MHWSTELVFVTSLHLVLFASIPVAGRPASTVLAVFSALLLALGVLNEVSIRRSADGS
jgi:hypothetical protein